MPNENEQVAARYAPGEPLDDLRAVAAREGGTVYEVPFGRSRILIAVWEDYSDSGSYSIRSEVVPAGHWLAHSGSFLYESSDGNWREFYDEVTE